MHGSRDGGGVPGGCPGPERGARPVPGVGQSAWVEPLRPTTPFKMNRPFLAHCVASAHAAIRQGKHDAALAWCRKALQVAPDLPEAWYNLGLALAGLRQDAKAIAALLKAAALAAANPDAQNSVGLGLMDLGAHAEALQCFDRALALAPGFALAHFNRGGLMARLHRSAESAAAFRAAIELGLEGADAYYHLGNALLDLKQPKAALLAHEQALARKPDYRFLPGTILNTRRLMCLWEDDAVAVEAIRRQASLGETACDPFVLLGLIDAPDLQRKVAELAVATQHPENGALGPIPRRARGDRIRVGYYSADFHNHATAYLMAELFELHDRAGFEVVGFSFGPDRQDEMRRRIVSALDRFIDVRDQSDLAVARLSRALGIDIAVDLKGHTLEARTGIFSYRAAPVQVNYLGYPGTLGAPYMDYLLADPTLIPADSQRHYAEKVVYLPDSYQVNDARRRITDRSFTRSELGLPAEGFVFCCFNNNHKITPDTFDGWMRILKRVDGSVLWLLEDNPEVVTNLRQEAGRREVDPDRLVFAQRLPLAEHLARHRAADLFLDTLPYNAHTTASDALWAGVPVLTRMGASFASRVAASLLHAMGLPELITTSQADYEALAIDLAGHPQRLAGIRQALERNRRTAPLFDTPLFARHLESAYRAMHERYLANLPAEHIHVPSAVAV